MTASRIQRSISLANFVALFAVASACTTPRLAHDPATTRTHEAAFASQAACVPSFPDTDDSYGGDAAYSVVLPTDDGGTSLWLFGDSFVRRPETHEGRHYPFVHNSIGLSHCDAHEDWRFEAFWGRDEEGRPAAFFEPDPNSQWVREGLDQSDIAPYYWLLDGFVAHDTLFVSLLRVVHAEARGPFDLPFRFAGVDLGRIPNHRDPPADWRVEISTLSDDREVFPGSAFVVTPRHLYAFAFREDEDGGSPRILSRLDLDVLSEWRADLSDSLETFTTDSTWRPGLLHRDAAILMQDDASEMSVHFDAESERWIAVYSELSPRQAIPSPIALRIRTAPALVGPWSEDEELVTLPESRPDHPRSRDENLFCYAGKAHPQFSTTNRLLVTYVCNLYARDPDEALAVLERLRTSVDLYRPRSISVDRRTWSRSGGSTR